MSLYSSMRMAANTLRAMDIGLHVVGQNIANANTPGYIREEMILAPAPTQQLGGLLLGMGVRVEAIVQKLDTFLEGRLRNAVSDRAAAEAREEVFTQLEGLLGELTDTDLSSRLNDFFSSISEVLNQPEDAAVRNLVVLQGRTLSRTINSLADVVHDLRTNTNTRVISTADEINRLTGEIRDLNIQIAKAEGGTSSASAAVGLEDQRLTSLEDLSRLISIQVTKQPSGTVNVFSGGDYLVFGGTVREVEVITREDRGLVVGDLQIAETRAPLDPESGQLRGMVDARDDVLADFSDGLDNLARTLAFEFNKIHSSGQGLRGYDELVSEFRSSGSDLALNEAGLPFEPVNGTLQVLVRNKTTGLSKTTDIRVNLSGLGDQTTVGDFVGSIDAIDGISAERTSSGHLKISSDSPDEEFSFAEDTSGVLAALGINSFFSGTGAMDLGIAEPLQEDPSKFAASRGGIAADTHNAVELAGFLDRPLETAGGSTLTILHDRFVSEVVQGSAVAQAEADGMRIFEETLRGQKLASSGVNIDEEVVNMLAYQRTYQASARFISTLNELFGVLVSM